MNRSLKRLDVVHQKLLDAVQPLDTEMFMQRPTDSEWSVAEIVQHLYLVEDRVIKDLTRAISAEPGRVSFFKKFLPMSVVALRIRKFQAPKAVNPIRVPEKDAVLANYNGARQTLKDICNSHDAKRFRTLVFNHPFFGGINGAATVDFVGYHEQRHLKQIRDVLKKLGA